MLTAFIEYAESILSSIFFGSNFFFYFSTTEYGAVSALLKPLLHTWSLGVEEQFYIAFPVLALVSYKIFRTRFLTILLVLSLLSLLFAEMMAVKNTDLNFYLPFSRFWELAAGSVLAVRELSGKYQRDGIWGRYLSVLGLFLVAVSILFFDGKTPHPGFVTIIPILGVTLIIGFSSRDELVGRVLGSRPFVWVGLVSYSAYLWHFPIFAFLRNVLNDFSDFQKVLAIALTFGLSAVSYVYVEKPFRRRDVISSRALIKSMSFALLVLVGFSVFAVDNNGFEGRFKIAKGFANYELDNEKLRKKSWSLVRARNKEAPYFKEVKNKVLIVGNSHAKDIFNALQLNISDLDGFDFLVGNMFQLNCLNESIDDYVGMAKIFYGSANYKDATTILVSTRYRTNDICYREGRFRTKSSDLDGLKYLIRRAKKDGKNVVVMGSSAEFKMYQNKWVTDYIYSLYAENDDIKYRNAFQNVKARADRLLYMQLDESRIELSRQVKRIADANNVYFYDKVPVICDFKSETCDAFTDDGYKMFFDYSHLTLEGAKFFGHKLLGDSKFIRLVEYRDSTSKISDLRIQ